jgi:hypothetical protein
MKRARHLDVLAQARRARNILNRVITYLEAQERAERRAGEKRLERESLQRIPFGESE